MKRYITKKTQISLHTLDKYVFFFSANFESFYGLLETGKT